MKQVLVSGILVAGMAAAVGVSPNNGAAQGSPPPGIVCGQQCVDCGYLKWEGIVDATYKGPWEQTCDFNPVRKYCTDCRTLGVASNFVSALTIASTIEALQEDQLSAVFKAYGDRIEVNPTRYQIIITGTECDANTPGAILNVHRETWAKLRELGVNTWRPEVPALMVI